MLAIKNNLMAVNAARHLGSSYNALASSVERLSSGLRINSAKDDAAGLAVRELMRADIAVIQQGARNALDGISMLQTMEGAMATIDDALKYCVKKSTASPEQPPLTASRCLTTPLPCQSILENLQLITSPLPAAT